MIRKTAKYKHRRDGDYTDRLLIETWWLFGLIPLYRRESITASNR